jgi:hypothetical protein
MSDKPEYDPTRPAWDKSERGSLPEPLAELVAESANLAAKQEAEYDEMTALSPEERLNRLDAIQEEAISLANSQGQSMMTAEQQFIYTWQREMTVAKASLEVFENPDNQVEDREARIETCRRTLATALYKLGRIEEALDFAAPFADLTGHIEFIQAAKEYPDDDLQSHACARERSVVDGKAIELDRRWKSEEVISELHGKLVKVWICTQCGVANASPETPERQQRYDATMHAQIHTAAKSVDGKMTNARGVARTPPNLEAARLLEPQS